MPGNLNDTVGFDITCPNCKYVFSKAIRELKINPQFPCPNGCGQAFDADNFKAEIEKVDKAIDDLRRKLRNI